MPQASSARILCAGSLWAVVGRPLTHVCFGRGCAAGAGAPGGSGLARGVVSVTHPTAGCLQSIPSGPHAMQADAARLRGRPHGMLRARVVLDRAAAWTRLGVRVARGRQPRGQRRGWREWAGG